MPLRIIPASGPTYRRKEFRIWPLDSNGTGGLVTSFSDGFDRANTSFGMGPNWMWGGNYNSSDSGQFPSQSISLNQFLWRTSVSAAGSQPLTWMPTPVMSAFMAKPINQFCQMRFILNDTVQGTRVLTTGPSCCNVDEDSQFKTIALSTSVNGSGFRDWGVDVWLNNAWTNLIASPSTSNQYSAGDILRLEATFLGATIGLTVKINGAVVGTGIAAAVGGQPVSSVGVPGITRRQLATSGFQTMSNIWDDFSCGPL